MTIVILPAARQDILGHFLYLIDEGAFHVAERFVAAVEETISKLTIRPRIGNPQDFQNPRLAGLRKWPVKGFPDIRIYYLVTESAIRVIRILHGKRNVSSILRREKEY